MLKKFKILPIILSLFSLLSAGAPDTLWTRTYGGDFTDIGSSVQQTSDGGFIIAGYKENELDTGKHDVYLIRTNSNGDTLWTKTYGGTGTERGYSICQTSDKGFIITGYEFPSDAGMSDVYLIKTNANGDTLWTKTYGGAYHEQGRSVQQTSDGGFIIAGVTSSFGAGDDDVYLIKTNSTGDTLWTKTYGDTNSNGSRSVQQTSDEGFIVAGHTYSSGTGNLDCYLIRTDSNGDTLWTRTYGDSLSGGGNSVQQTTDGGFIIVGNARRTDSVMIQVYIFKTDTVGDVLWAKIYGGTGDEYGWSVQQTGDGGFIVAGLTSSYGAGNGDVYLIRTDPNGDTLWTKTYGGSASDYGNSVRQTSDGGFIIVGVTSSFGSGWVDVYLIRLEPEVGIQEEIPSNFKNPNNFIVFYNHGKKLISISYIIPYSTSVKLEAYDIKGKLFKVIQNQFMHKDSYSVNWDSKRFGSGVYFLRLSAAGSEVSSKVTVIR